MQKNVFVVVVLSMAVVAMPASAYWCQGTVSDVNVYAGGNVTVSVPGQHIDIYLCSLTTNFGTSGQWTPQDCKAVYAMLLSAKLSGQQVIMGFNDNFTCANPQVGAQGTSAYSVEIP